MNSLRLHRFFPRYFSSQVPVTVPIIKIPKYVEKHVEKVKKKEFLKVLTSARKRKILYRGDTSKPVIKSTIGDYNHYLGQKYNDRYPLTLQSKLWHKIKSIGEKFTIKPLEKNPALPSSDPDEYLNDEFFPNEFSKMQLNEIILNNLQYNLNFEKPTRIQSLAIPKIMLGSNLLLATETGCGKTAAYLAPILHNLMSMKRTVKPPVDSPMGLIITPGRELADQIGDVAFRMAKDAGLCVKVLISEGTHQRHLKIPPNIEVDLMVASIGCLVKLLQKRKIFLSYVKHIVLDEADTLLDDSFQELTSEVLKRLMIRTKDISTASGTQIILSSSVYPTNVQSIFSDGFTEKDIEKICSTYLHRVPAHISQKFHRISTHNWSGEILDLVKNDYLKKKPVLIFCNKSMTCDWLSTFLEENGVPNAVFHGAVDPHERLSVFKRFQSGDLNVLCCTDLASRGLDTQRVTHVINFDFPNSTSDYLLRVGRVGRIGSNHGHVTNLVLAKSGIYTVREIERAVRLSQRIENVDSNIKQKINKLYFSY